MVKMCNVYAMGVPEERRESSWGKTLSEETIIKNFVKLVKTFKL